MNPGPTTAVAPTPILTALKVNRLSFLFFAGLSCVTAVESTGAVVAAGVAPNMNPRLGLAIPVIGGLRFMLVVSAVDGARGGAQNWKPFTVVVVVVLVSGFDLLIVFIVNVNPPAIPAVTTGVDVAPKYYVFAFGVNPNENLGVFFFPVHKVTAPLLTNIIILLFPHIIHLIILFVLFAPQDTQLYPYPLNKPFDTGGIILPLSTFTAAVVIGVVDGTVVPSGLAALHDCHWVVTLGLNMYQLLHFHTPSFFAKRLLHTSPRRFRVRGLGSWRQGVAGSGGTCCSFWWRLFDSAGMKLNGTVEDCLVFGFWCQWSCD